MVRRRRRCLSIVAALVAAAFLAPGAMAAEHTDSEMTILEPRKDAVLKVDKFIQIGRASCRERV